MKFYSNAYAKRRGKQTRLPELPKEVSEEVWVEVPAKAEEVWVEVWVEVPAKAEEADKAEAGASDYRCFFCFARAFERLIEKTNQTICNKIKKLPLLSDRLNAIASRAFTL